MTINSFTYKRWDEVLTIINGKDYKDVEDPDGIYPICGSGGKMGLANQYLCPENTVIIGRKGNINKPLFITEKFWNIDTAFGLVADERFILPKYLYYFCCYFNFERLNKTVTIPSLTKKDLLKIKMSIPPMHIQQSIIQTLDLLNDIICKKQDQIRQFDLLEQAIFYQMFGDPVSNEKKWDVGSLSDYAPAIINNSPVNSEKVWLLNLDKIEPNTGRVLDKVYVSRKELGSSTYPFNEQNVLYSKLRPYLNKVVIPNQAGYATTELVPLLPNKDFLDRYYLACLLRSTSFVNFICGKVAGAKMPRVSMKEFRKFEIPLPPLSIQKDFANKILAIKSQQNIIRQSIKEIEQLLNMKMDEYFG